MTVENIFTMSLIVFAFTLLVTKSTIFACKRKYVKDRYQYSANVGNVCFIHKAWHAIWSCAMCSGMWFSIGVCLLMSDRFFVDVLCCFSLNWLIHLLEDYLYTNSRNQGSEAGREVT